MSGEDWLRQWGETEGEYVAFKHYLEQTPPRALSRIPPSIRPVALARVADRHDWFNRVIAYDRTMQRVRDAERQEVARYTAHDRQVANEQLLAASASILTRELAKLLAASEATEAAGLIKPEALLKAIPDFVKLSRLLGGETTSNDSTAADPYAGATLQQLQQIAEILKGNGDASSD